jgi:trigger factor
MDDLEALKTAIREQIQGEYDKVSRQKVKRELLDKLSDAHDFQVPQSMVDMEFDGIWKQVEQAKEKGELDPEDEGKSDDELKADYTKLAERRVRLGLLLSDVGQPRHHGRGDPLPRSGTGGVPVLHAEPGRDQPAPRPHLRGQGR